MPMRQIRWLRLAIVSVLVIALMAGCAAQERPDDDNLNNPDQTRAPGDIGNNMGDRNNGWMGNGNRDTGDNGFADNDRNRNNGGNRSGMNDNGTQNNTGGGVEGNMRLADDVADRLTNMREIDAATVLLTDDNAFVAVDLPGDQEGRVTNDLKERISDEVRHLDRDIANVYVSADPDFFDRVNGYARDIRNGQPVDGMMDEINETIRRVFPTAH